MPLPGTFIPGPPFFFIRRPDTVILMICVTAISLVYDLDGVAVRIADHQRFTEPCRRVRQIYPVRGSQLARRRYL